MSGMLTEQQLREMDIGKLLEYLPSHMHLAKNKNAIPDERFTFYRKVGKGNYLHPKFPTVRGLIQYYYPEFEDVLENPDDANQIPF